MRERPGRPSRSRAAPRRPCRQRMLAQGLAETNRVNLTVVEKKQEIKALEAEREKLMQERERLQVQRTTVVREEPKDKKDQKVHDSRYKRAVAAGTLTGRLGARRKEGVEPRLTARAV